MNLTFASSTAMRVLNFLQTSFSDVGFLTILVLAIGIPLIIYVANIYSDWILGVTDKEEKKRSHWP